MDLLKKFLSDELHLDPETYIEQFKNYESLLLDWNQKINLISRKSTTIEDHILNSIFFLKNYDISGIRSMADIGTGGGFPGIPLKILFPDMEMLLLDSIKKKMMVVEDIVTQMKFQNVKVVCGRAEEISKELGYRNKYDITEELSLLNKKRYKFNSEVINFELHNSYGIEDKKLVVIKRKSSL